MLARCLEKLHANELYCDIEKCEFYIEEVLYLGMIVGKNGIKMDSAKVATIKGWDVPKNVKDVQSFLDFANLYRRFIRTFSGVAKPLTTLTGKVSWKWTAESQDAFEHLKTLVCTTPIPALYDPEKECIIGTDAFDYVSAERSLNPMRLVAFGLWPSFRRKHSPAECILENSDKELLAVVLAFERWRAELELFLKPIKAFSDHNNLECFMSIYL